MTNSKKACKYCKEFYPVGELLKLGAGLYCSIDHAYEFATDKRKKLAEKKAKAIVSEKRKQHQADKERIKTRAQRLKEAQTAINWFVRLRDKGRPCISCDKPDNGQHQRHCSHYKSVGSNSALRFNLHNMHASCSVCNNHLSGNIGEYTPRLIKKIGREKYEWLLTQNQAVKYENEYLDRLKKVFNKKARMLRKKQLNLAYSR